MTEGLTRPDWDAYFMEITYVVAKRSTCLRRQVGAILAVSYTHLTLPTMAVV